MKIKLPDTVSSAQDLNALSLEIRDYAKWYAHETIKRRVVAKASAYTKDLSPAAEQLISEQGGKKELTGAALDDLVRILDEYKQTAPTMDITLAAPASRTTKATLVAWCRDNIAPNVLVTFHFNAGLLGGMVVRYGSRVFDWSFRRQLLANRAHFPEVLRRV